MKKISFILLVTLILSVINIPQATAAVSYRKLAEYYAPTIYHDVDDDWEAGIITDFITKVNYDNDWAGNNNWEHLNQGYPLKAYVYYAVQETYTHYFIHYGFFHPRDDGFLDIDKHENDFEGMLVVIRKNGTTYGELHLMETLAHNNFYQYTNFSEITDGTDDVDGNVYFNTYTDVDGIHPKVFIQSGGHGVYGYDNSSAPGGDGMVYRYKGIAEIPEISKVKGSYTYSCSYDLISIDELWDRQFEDGNNGRTFDYTKFGALNGDTYEDDSARLPWAWDDTGAFPGDRDDGPVYSGMNFSDPAYTIDVHLNGLGNFSHNYIHNPYYTHKIYLNKVKPTVDTDGWGKGNPDIFSNVYIDNKKIICEDMWKKNDASVNLWHIPKWKNISNEDIKKIYVCSPLNSDIRFDVLDSDTGPDDEMGTINFYNLPQGSVRAGEYTLSKSVINIYIYCNRVK